MNKVIQLSAVLALLGFPVAVLGYRTQLFGFATSFKLVSWSVYLAMAVLIGGVFVWFLKRKTDMALAKSGLICGLLMLIPIVGLGSQAITARNVPAIHNISTDTQNPPAFDKIATLRTEDHNPLQYDAERLAEVQRAAYPKVKTLFTDLSVAEAHAEALRLVEASGWELVNDDAGAGVIEATDTTRLWGFKDDVVIRISEQNGQRAVDLRSVSRIGRSDLGANARRIKGFLTAFKHQ
jgi:hypothetical protein